MKKKNFDRKQRIFPFILLYIFWFIYFYKVIFFGEVFYTGDNHSINIPFISFFIENLKSGQIPWWNPYILSGVPFLLPTNILIFFSSPLFFLLPTEIALTHSMILINLFAGISMYLFCHALTKNRTSSFYSALVYMFSGMLARFHSSYVTSLQVAYFPLILYFVEIYTQTKKKRYAFLTGFFLFLAYLSGHPMLLLITLISLIFYTLTKTGISLKSKTIFLSLTLLLFFFFSSPFLFFQIQSFSLSTRPSSDFNYSTSSSFPPIFLITLILPHFFGIPEIELSNNTSSFAYIGVLPFLLAVLGIKKYWRNYKTIFFLLLSGLILSFGKYTPVYKFALLLPGLSLFRQPIYFLMTFIFALSFFAGLGLREIIENFHIKYISDKIKLLLLSFFLISVGFYTYLQLANTSFWYTFINLISTFFPNKNYMHLVDKIDKIKFLSVISSENIAFVSTILFISLLFINKVNSAKKLLIYIVIVTFLDLYVINQKEIFSISHIAYKKLFTNSNIPDELKNPNYRIAQIFPAEYKNWKVFSVENYLTARAQSAEKILYPNRNMLYHVDSAFGFSPLIPSSYVNFISNKKYQNISGITDSDVDLNQLSKAGVRYIISSIEVPDFKSPQYKLLISKPNYYIYEDTLAVPRAHLRNSNNQIVGNTQITLNSPNSITIETSSEEETNLILLDNYYPGWRAYVDEVETEIFPYQDTFRMVKVSAGNHAVEFLFKPSFLILFSKNMQLSE